MSQVHLLPHIERTAQWLAQVPTQCPGFLHSVILGFPLDHLGEFKALWIVTAILLAFLFWPSSRIWLFFYSTQDIRHMLLNYLCFVRRNREGMWPISREKKEEAHICFCVIKGLSPICKGEVFWWPWGKELKHSATHVADSCNKP